MPSGDIVSVVLQFQRDADDEEDEEEASRRKPKGKDDPSAQRVVYSARFPVFAERRMEGWWVAIGDYSNNVLLTVKRIPIGDFTKAKVEFAAPETPGDYKLRLYLISDSYFGCDQEYSFPLTVVPDDE